MAITAHYILKMPSAIILKTRLIAFCFVPGSHDGPMIGNTFLDILETLGLEPKIGQITSDNASNNISAMEWIEDVLTARGIPFSSVSNHDRYAIHLHYSSNSHDG
jgi:hypothetical protein